jgi:choline/ethanolamine kinase
MVAIENQNQSQAAEAVAAPASRIPREARRLLHELAAAWADVADCRALEVVPLKGAMTNEVYQARWLTAGPAGQKEEPRAEREVRKVLVRIYGDGVDLFFDREDEVRTFECMSRHGQGPRLLGRFPNGRVEEFIHARVLSTYSIPPLSKLILTCPLAVSSTSVHFQPFRIYGTLSFPQFLGIFMHFYFFLDVRLFCYFYFFRILVEI